MTARMFRAPASVVKRGGRGAVIQDNGVMRGTLPASSGYFLFSGVGAGVKPLCLVGTWDDVLRFLMERKASGVQNQIETLPDIYMSVEKYVPKPRFVGLLPFQDSIKSLIGGLTNLFPGNQASDIIGGVSNVRDGRGKGYATKHTSSASGPSNLLVVTWHYLQSSGMDRIGSGTITFAEMYGVIDQRLNEIHGLA